jgi:hypothetical protein
VKPVLPVVLSALLLGVMPAAGAAETTFEYKIEHPRYGDIGTYANVVRSVGDAYEIQTELHVAVKVLGIVMHREDAKRTERWQGDRLVSFEGVTITNGDRLEIRGEAQGDNFVVTTPAGKITAPASVHPSNPWGAKILDADVEMSTKNGRVDKVVVSGGNEEPTTFDGKNLMLRRYQIDGPKRQVVWLDKSDVVVAFRTIEDGTPIDFILSSLVAPDDTPAQAAQH